MKIFLSLLLGLFLGGAVLSYTALGEPVADLKGQVSGYTFRAVGTLADANNPVEMAVAPLYTRLITVRQRAAWMLKNDRIPVESAVEIQTLADAARQYLDTAAKVATITDPQFQPALHSAEDRISIAEQRLDALKKGQ